MEMFIERGLFCFLFCFLCTDMASASIPCSDMSTQNGEPLETGGGSHESRQSLSCGGGRRGREGGRRRWRRCENQVAETIRLEHLIDRVITTIIAIIAFVVFEPTGY